MTHGFPPLTAEDIDMFVDFAHKRREHDTAVEAVKGLKRWTFRLGPSHKVWSKPK